MDATQNKILTWLQKYSCEICSSCVIQALKGDRILKVLLMSEKGRPWRRLTNQEFHPHKTQATFWFVYCTVQKAKSCDLYSSSVIKVTNLVTVSQGPEVQFKERCNSKRCVMIFKIGFLCPHWAPCSINGSRKWTRHELN